MQRVVVKRGGLNMEFDIILVDGDTVVVVEVKSTLKVDDVREYLHCLERLFNYLPEHRGKRILGAVSCIAADEQSERYAASQGLFMIGLTGENLVSIRNPLDFVPWDFG
jgi:RecB family endonuclease NucS